MLKVRSEIPAVFSVKCCYQAIFSKLSHCTSYFHMKHLNYGIFLMISVFIDLDQHFKTHVMSNHNDKGSKLVRSTVQIELFLCIKNRTCIIYTHSSLSIRRILEFTMQLQLPLISANTAT